MHGREDKGCSEVKPHHKSTAYIFWGYERCGAGGGCAQRIPLLNGYYINKRLIYLSKPAA